MPWTWKLRTGLSDGEDDEGVRRIDKGVRWIAVRRAADHIHVVAMLARQDGRRPRLSFDRLRVRDACRAAEDRCGLRKTDWLRSFCEDLGGSPRARKGLPGVRCLGRY